MADSNYEMIRTEKDKLMLKHAGFLHWRKSAYISGKGVESVYYRCIFFQAGPSGDVSSKCGGRLTLCNGVVEMTAKHNHAADPVIVERKNFQNRVKDQALDEKHKLGRTITAEEVDKVPDFAKSHVSQASSNKNVRRYRNKANAVPASPQTLKQLQIPREFRYKSNDELFLQDDTWMDDDNRVLIFSTKRALDLLEKSTYWGADGTFKVVPLLFSQLWVLYIRLEHCFVPLVHVLMNSKSMAAYLYVLERIKTLRPMASPLKVATDFEQAEIKAFAEAFPGILHCLCLFHFSQSLYRQLCSQGFQTRYGEDGQFRLAANMIGALAFVPSSEIPASFDLLEDELLADTENGGFPELQGMLAYFEGSYVGRVIKKTEERRQPLYPPQKWSVYQRVLDGEPRTTNGIEAMNNQIGQSVGAKHPTVWNIIPALANESTLAVQKMEAYLAGAKLPTRKGTYLDLDSRLLTVVERYGIMDRIEYLRAVAANMRLA